MKSNTRKVCNTKFLFLRVDLVQAPCIHHLIFCACTDFPTILVLWALIIMHKVQKVVQQSFLAYLQIYSIGLICLLLLSWAVCSLFQNKLICYLSVIWSSTGQLLSLREQCKAGDHKYWFGSSRAWCQKLLLLNIIGCLSSWKNQEKCCNWSCPPKHDWEIYDCSDPCCYVSSKSMLWFCSFNWHILCIGQSNGSSVFTSSCIAAFHPVSTLWCYCSKLSWMGDAAAVLDCDAMLSLIWKVAEDLLKVDEAVACFTLSCWAPTLM